MGKEKTLFFDRSHSKFSCTIFHAQFAYRLDGCNDTLMQQVAVAEEPLLYLPTAFSPNTAVMSTGSACAAKSAAALVIWSSV